MYYKRMAFLIVTIPFLLASPLSASQVIDWKIISEKEVKQQPLDMTFSWDGQWLYLLTKNGDLIVYSNTGELKGSINAGNGFDQILAGPREDQIFLLSRKSKKIRIIEVIPPQEISVSDSPYKGAVDAPVVITEFTDFQCPHCAKLGPIFDRLLKLYPGKIKIVYKNYPLGGHRYAWVAAANAMAAHKKNKFWEFHDLLFKNHDKLDDQKILEIRKMLGLDTLEFKALTKSQDVRSKVASDRNEGNRIGVRGTPTVFVNGKKLKNKSLEGFKQAIEKELKSIRK